MPSTSSMLSKLVNKLIKKLGRERYQIDPMLNAYELFLILMNYLVKLYRGLLIKPFLIKSEGILFVGKGCSIKNKHKIEIGRTVQMGDNVKINALSKYGIKIGNNVTILDNTIIECTGVIRNLGDGLILGNNIGISQNCFIQVRGKVEIGNNVILGPYVSIFSENHNFGNPDLPVNMQGETRKGVKIEDGVWLGAHSTILDGVIVGKNSIVAAGSMVTKNVDPYTVVGGIPAKLIKKRK